MRIFVMLIMAIALLGGEVAWTGALSRAWQRLEHERHNPRKELETRIAEAGLALHGLSTSLPQNMPGRAYTIRAADLAKSALYLRDETSDRNYLYADAEGYVHRDGAVIRQVRHELYLLVDADELSIFADSALMARLPRNRWTTFLVGFDDIRMPAPIDMQAASIRDGFMRETFADDNWEVESGDWRFHQFGGGMAASEKEAESADFRRAVNPFSLTGRNYGLAKFGRPGPPNGRIAARFYYGRPHHGKVVDLRPLTPETDMLLTVGSQATGQYAFGWYGAAGTFCLLQRRNDSPWTVIERHKGPRPPISNWMKLEVRLLHGSTVVGLVDDVVIVDKELEKRVEGAFAVACGKDEIELDDVELDTFPLPPQPPGSPVFIKSRNFAAKDLKDHKDPVQYQQWTRGTNTFIRSLEKFPDNRILRSITTRIPIYGDMYYESVPHNDEVGDLPDGNYQFKITSVRTPDTSVTVEASHDPKGWQVRGLPDSMWPEGHHEFTLRLLRTATDGDRPSIVINGTSVPLADPLKGPVTVTVSRWYTSSERLDPPTAELNTIRDGNLRHELFEEAATDWNWIEGGFRMDARWACQSEWNFMACGGTGVPWISSKTAFNGDQEHDYHITLRPCTPWDSGNANWEYSRAEFDRHEGWYNRHDLNFSFCADPRDPLSGYAIVFAGEDNRRTLLLRNGKVLAATNSPLISSQRGIGTVHWTWWHFHVSLAGNTIKVSINDEAVFDVQDPTPLTGGHIGFWTVRGGFVVSRLSSTADELSHDAARRYVPESIPAPFWRPLVPDSLQITTAGDPEHERATMLSGAGFQAVRHVYAEPIDLQATPVIQLDLKPSVDAHVNIHLQIDNRPWLLQVNAPVTDMKQILTPAEELDGEQFQLDRMTETQVKRVLLGQVEAGKIQVNLVNVLSSCGYTGQCKLQAITVGNSSNTDYLLAGGSGNRSGEWYELSQPTFLPRQP